MAAGDVVRLEVSVRRDEVLRFLGYPEEFAPPRHIDALIDEAVAVGHRLARAAGTWERLAVGQAGDVGLSPMDATDLVIGLATAGAHIEARVEELMGRGEVAQALLLDAVGSAVAEEAADRLSAAIVGNSGLEEVPEVPCRLSPGYGAWPLSAQPLLFQRLRHRDLGVTLLPSLLMLPRKSISFAMWLGSCGPPAQGLAGCSRCALPHCRYRRTPPAGVP